MAADDILDGLSDFDGRIAGTDAERRAAVWLATALRSGTKRLGRVRLETFWCHPNWALAAAWHVGLALAASLVSVSTPKVGGAMLIVAIVSVILDAHTGRSPGRLLTPYRATQNVVVTASAGAEPPVTLLVTASLDSPRAGLIHRRSLRRLTAWLRSFAGPATPGWAGWLALTMALVLATAVARAGGSTGGAIGALQLVPTVGLVLALALLIDQASAGPAPATENAAVAAVAAAVALTRALTVAPPARARVELLLQGAGDSGALGLRRHLRAHQLTAPTAVILALDTTRTDRLGWWFSDGPLLPLRALAIIRRQAAIASEALPNRTPAVIHGRGAGPALPGLVRHIPTLQVGSGPGDIDALVQFALQIVDAIDTALAERKARG
jgi:hypothetical protein